MVRVMKKLIFVFVCLIIRLTFAQELEGTRGTALSGAMRGTVGLNEAIYYNPATLAFSQKYSIEAHSSFLPSQAHNPDWVYGGSVVDATSELFAAGLGYYRKTQFGKENSDSESAFHLALSKAIHPFISAGLTTKYLWSESDGIINVDGGLFGLLTPKIHMGIVGHNLLGNHFLGRLERQLGLGTRIQAWDFLYTSLDILKKLDGPFAANYSLRSAIEMIHENGTVVQGGLSLSDISSQNIYSLGCGWAKHKFGIFYAFKNSMDSLRQNAHVLSMRVFF